MTTSLLEQEINEQPRVIQQLLDQETEPVTHLATRLRDSFDYILIAARGTSDNAARYAQYIFGIHNHLTVALAAPSLFTFYDQPPRLTGALVIGISQSGQSPDIRAVIAEGRRQGRPTLAITNDPASPLATAAEYTIPLHAGPERAIAASKTYTASLGVLALFSAGLAGDTERLKQLRRLPELMGRSLLALEPVKARIERYRFMNHCVVIGRGYNYATAFEIALKMKELNYLLIDAYSSADFQHGPIAVIEQGFPTLLVAPSGDVYPDMLGLARELCDRGAELIAISDRPEALDMAVTPLQLPVTVPEWLSPIICVIPGQLLAHDLTLAKGYDPDHPRGLRKVTLTK